MRRLLVSAIAWLAGTALLAGQQWPSFRGLNAAGVADGHPTPVTWNAATGENILWKTPVPGVAVSSPIVWDDRLFVSTAVSSKPDLGIRTGLYGDVEPLDDQSRHTWHLLALDRRTGKVLWDRLVREGIPRTKRHPKSSRASPTPVTDGRHVIVSFGSEGLYAYDVSGKLLWKRDLGVLNAGWFYDPDYEWGVGSSPIIWKNLVIVQCDIQKNSFIAAFDVRTGAPVWRTGREEIPSWSTPTIYDDNGHAELVTQATTFTRGYDPRTGKELWRLSGNSEIAIPTPIIGPGLIIVTNGYRGVQPIVAIKPGASGDITLKDNETTNSSVAWSTKRGGPYIPTPVLYRDQLYVCQNNGVVAAYDVRTGARVYQERLGDGGSFSASPVAADGKIYFASEDGDVFVVRAGSTFELLAKNSMGEILMATPAISGGVLFVRGLKHVFAIGQRPAEASAIAQPRAQEHQHPATAEKLGTVHFPTSCSAAAQPAFDRALALLHSFEFGSAITGFNAALGVDPGCAMAYWGIALSRWTNPFVAGIRPAARLQQGLDAVKQAQQAGAKTERERAYITAVSKLFVDFEKTDQRARVMAYEKAMADLAAAYPDDREASIFWALSLGAAALPADKTYANQLKAGAILERIYVEQPDHPGIAHYIIHSYDVPPLASRALEAATRYATIAPSAPHALHMPSHTFTRVGAWQDSIDANIASAAAARRGGDLAEQLHATDYMTYAYLQTGQDSAARRLMSGLPEIAARFDPAATVGSAPGSAGVFALAAIPARWALERRDWAGAAKLEPHPSSFPYTEAVTHFARALGAAHTGALADARASIDALLRIRDRLAQANEAYWVEQVEIERGGASAFVALKEGRAAEAVALMQEAARREDATEKSAVTPGPIAPARELLGEMLLQMRQPREALKEFEATLRQEPNRFRAVYGAAKSARLAGDRTTARTYYTQLLKMCPRADRPVRAELAEARIYGAPTTGASKR